MAERGTAPPSKPNWYRSKPARLAAGLLASTLALTSCASGSEDDKPEKQQTARFIEAYVVDLANNIASVTKKLKPFRTSGNDKDYYSVKPLLNPENSAAERWPAGVVPGNIDVEVIGETTTYVIGRMREGMTTDATKITVKSNGGNTQFVSFQPRVYEDDITPQYTPATLLDLTGGEIIDITQALGLANSALATFQSDGVGVDLPHPYPG